MGYFDTTTKVEAGRVSRRGGHSESYGLRRNEGNGQDCRGEYPLLALITLADAGHTISRLIKGAQHKNLFVDFFVKEITKRA